MTIEVKVPQLPESVADATIVAWHKNVGDSVERDENLVDLETDKVVLEVPAPQSGVITEIKKIIGNTVTAEEILAVISPADGAAVKVETKQAAQPAAAATSATKADHLTPSVKQFMTENNLSTQQIQNISGSGKQGQLTKQDLKNVPIQQSSVPLAQGERIEKRVPMSRMRARIAERLVSAQHDAAMLTTFNEVNLHALMNIRKQYKDQFEKVHGARLGFMSFFTKAVIEALKRFPAVNASLDGQDIIYHGYYDIGIAVSTERGLVVPVLRDADRMSMAQIEKGIGEFANRARDGKLTMEEMSGGTFTITNGGVFGSLLATPIINPPQVGILGMHKIEERPVVENGQIVIRPMMYIALTYDHRIIDGKESVQFLVTVKELLEDPSRILLEV